MNHAVKGITNKDFELAHKIEDIIIWQPGKLGGALEDTRCPGLSTLNVIKRYSKWGSAECSVDDLKAASSTLAFHALAWHLCHLLSQEIVSVISHPRRLK